MDRWLRLLLVAVGSVLCMSIVSGGPVFIQLFVAAGVGSSKCADVGVDASGSPPASCEAQIVAVSSVVNGGGMATMVAGLPCGVLFDRFGGRALGVMGAFLVIFGQALMQMSLFGAAHGLDSWTFTLFSVAIVVVEFGCQLNSYVTNTMLWHFPDRQASIITLLSTSGVLGSMLPALIKPGLAATGYKLNAALWLYIIGSCFGAVACSYAPTLEEYRKAAKQALGMPLPKPGKTSVWQSVKRTNIVLMHDWKMHSVFLISIAVGAAAGMVSDSFCSLFAQELFTDPKLADALPSASVLIYSAAAIVAPMITMCTDTCHNPLRALLVVSNVFGIVGTILYSYPTWNGQMVSNVCFSINGVLSGTIGAQYVLRFFLPTNMGTALGLYLGVYLAALMMPILRCYYAYIGDGRDLPDTLKAIVTLATAAGIFQSLQLWYNGLPEQPLMLESDKHELASMFYCETIEQVAEITNKESREVLKMMSSQDPTDMLELLQSIDYDRVTQVTGRNTEEADIILSKWEEDEALPTKPSNNHVQEAASVCFFGAALVALGIGIPAYDSGSACAVVSPEPQTVGAGFDFDDDWMSAPLLTNQVSVAPAIEKQNQVRQVNERLWAATFAADAAGILQIYNDEDETLLYEAYEDLYKWKGPDEIDAMENVTAEMDLDAEFEALMNRKPALRVLFLKMMTFRLQRQWLS